MNIPSRGSEEERIRIPCRYGLIYRVMDIINKTELGKYVSVHVRYRVTWHTSAALAEGGSEVMAGREWKVSGSGSGWGSRLLGVELCYLLWGMVEIF